MATIEEIVVKLTLSKKLYAAFGAVGAALALVEQPQDRPAARLEHGGEQSGRGHAVIVGHGLAARSKLPESSLGTAALNPGR